MKTPSILFALALIALPACGGGGPGDLVADAQAALTEKDYAKAADIAVQAAAEAKAAGDGVLEWRATKLHIDALAQSDAVGEPTVAALAAAASGFDGKVNEETYITSAAKLRKSGHLESAIKVVDAGLKAYPDAKEAFQPHLDKLLAQASENEDSPALALLKQLGYVGN